MAKPKLSIASIGKTTTQLANLLTSQQGAAVPTLPESSAPQPPTVAAPVSAPKQSTRKLIGFRVSKAGARQIEKMAWEEELTVQAFLLKTINEYRRSKGLDPLPE
jgi:uncharacterized protein YkwD